MGAVEFGGGFVREDVGRWRGRTGSGRGVKVSGVGGGWGVVRVGDGVGRGGGARIGGGPVAELAGVVGFEVKFTHGFVGVGALEWAGGGRIGVKSTRRQPAVLSRLVHQGLLHFD